VKATQIKQYAKRELLRQQHVSIFKKWTKEEAIYDEQFDMKVGLRPQQKSQVS